MAVFGGSLGAGRLNEAVAAAYGEEDPTAPLVLQVTGRGKLAGSAPHDRLRVFEYCDSMPRAARTRPTSSCAARAASIWEVAAAGAPAILVPWSGAAADHQAVNAALLRSGRRGGAGRGARRPAAAEPRSTGCWRTTPRRRRAGRCDARAGAAGRGARRGRRGAGAGRGRCAMHLAGIGGVGMSGIARVLHGRGRAVSGCDRADGAGPGRAARARHRLRRRRTTPRTWRAWTSWWSRRPSTHDEPELVRARELGMPIRHRSEALAAVLAEHRRRIVVAGAHGKTTTSAMLAVALTELGDDPTFLVGGEVSQLGTNAAAGDGDLCLAEGDESDRSVAGCRPDIAVVLNVELDHHDHYASRRRRDELLGGWTARLPADGVLVAGDGVDLPAPRTVARSAWAGGGAARARRPRAGRRACAFRPSRGPAAVRSCSPCPGPTTRRTPVAACVLDGVRLRADRGRRGARDVPRRRPAIRGARRAATAIRVVDDYAHHPAELAATLAAARAVRRRRPRAGLLPAAHAVADPGAAARVRRGARRPPTWWCVCDVYVARGRPEPGVIGR